MPTIKTYTLNPQQTARLDRLAEGNDFWRSIRDKYAEYGSLTQKQMDRLRDELGKDKLPKLPSHDSSERVGVINKILRDNKPVCRHCRELATVAVGLIGVCAAHVETQEEAEAAYRAARV
jgi:hypothetical protein